VLVKKIALSLQAEIYLPNDYLIYKDDIGDEMYFISIGSVNIIAPDNSKVIKTLEQGDFFGEIALINNSRRMCSVIAQTLCLVFALKRKNFNEILHSFPDLLKKIRIQSEIRSRETTSIVKNYGNIVDDDTEQNKLFNHLSMYSMLSSSFASVIEDKHKLSLLSGMKNMGIDMSFETFAKDRSQLRIFKRRPVLGGLNERRKSQEALGKKLVIKRFDNLKNKWSHKI
jgi:CRP-like cAMP-binding protein